MMRMKRILMSVVLSVLLVTPALATTINFDSLLGNPPSTFQGITPPPVVNPQPVVGPPTDSGPFRVAQVLSSVDWTQNQGVAGNAGTAVFNRLNMENTEGNTSSHLVTFIPTLGLFSNNGDAGKYSEFTFKGVDIYHENSAFLQVDIDAFESFDSPVPVFGLSIGIPGSPEPGWFHYDLEALNIRINTNMPEEYAHNAIIGALVFGAGHVTTTSGFVFGFDNIQVCQNGLPCTYDAPISFGSTGGPVIPPDANIVTNLGPVSVSGYIGGAVPEASTWWYLMLAAGMIVGIRKFAQV